MFTTVRNFNRSICERMLPQVDARQFILCLLMALYVLFLFDSSSLDNTTRRLSGISCTNDMDCAHGFEREYVCSSDHICVLKNLFPMSSSDIFASIGVVFSSSISAGMSQYPATKWRQWTRCWYGWWGHIGSIIHYRFGLCSTLRKSFIKCDDDWCGLGQPISQHKMEASTVPWLVRI